MLRCTHRRLADGLLGTSGSTLRLRLARMGAYAIPHVDKLATGGEDGFFLSRFHDAIGVADGVGGWRESGVDPSLFTRDLMRNALANAEAAHRAADHPSATATPKLSAQGIMSAAYARTVKEHKQGSCTAAFAVLDDTPLSAAELQLAGCPAYCLAARGNGSKRTGPVSAVSRTLNIALVGDCGVCVLRNGVGVAFATREQQRAFNFPMQLGADAESPSDALITSFDVVPGDLVILGSDGLFDNIFVDHLPEMTVMAMGGPTAVRPRLVGMRDASWDLSEFPVLDCQHIARVIAESTYEATQRPEDKAPMTPFELRAEFQRLRHRGMKPDDITVVVAQIGIAADDAVLEVAEANAPRCSAIFGRDTLEADMWAAAASARTIPTRREGALTVVVPTAPQFQLVDDFFAAKKNASHSGTSKL